MKYRRRSLRRRYVPKRYKSSFLKVPMGYGKVQIDIPVILNSGGSGTAYVLDIGLVLCNDPKNYQKVQALYYYVIPRYAKLLWVPGDVKGASDVTNFEMYMGYDPVTNATPSSMSDILEVQLSSSGSLGNRLNLYVPKLQTQTIKQKIPTNLDMRVSPNLGTLGYFKVYTPFSVAAGTELGRFVLTVVMNVSYT